MESNDIVRRFVDAAVSGLQEFNLMRLPIRDMPDEMRDLSIEPRNDWVGWRVVPSTVTDEDLDDLEQSIGLAYPPSYRAFLKVYHFYELLSRGLDFCRHPIHTWKSELAKLYDAWNPERILGIGLIPFGDERMMDAGPVCFDTRSRAVDGDCPVVFWDHDWIGTKREIRPMFSSSERMFTCLAFATEQRVDFMHGDPEEPLEDLAVKQALLAEFLALDPNGAGGPARDYWTAWGIQP